MRPWIGSGRERERRRRRGESLVVGKVIGLLELEVGLLMAVVGYLCLWLWGG